MATATQKALGIPELLEAMLLELPPKDLILSQRVNKTLKAVFEASTKIQEKLFFKQPSTHGDSTVKINPLLVRILKHHCPKCCVSVLHTIGGKYYRLREISKDAKDEDLCIPGDKAHYWIKLDDIDREFSLSPQSFGSYKDMLISDSPIRIMFGSKSLGYSIIGSNQADTIFTIGSLIKVYFRYVSPGSERY